MDGSEDGVLKIALRSDVRGGGANGGELRLRLVEELLGNGLRKEGVRKGKEERGKGKEVKKAK